MQPQDLALARGELVELRIGLAPRRICAGEGVQHEAGQPRREDGVAVAHAAHGVGELGPEIVLVT